MQVERHVAEAHIEQIQDAVSEPDCRALIEACGDHRELRRERITDASVVSLVERLASVCVDRARVVFRRSLRAETILLARLGPGGRHRRHADNCRQNERGEWVPNHTPKRVVSAIYYLNSDFEGGEIVFEQHGLIIKPLRGLLLMFPSDQHHVHEVRSVRAGQRYTLPIWMMTA
jgi:predicted 2-oxoglutarate/Fe(II)-dependent dioxygenase YbiX